MRKPQATEQEMIGAARAMLDPLPVTRLRPRARLHALGRSSTGMTCETLIRKTHTRPQRRLGSIRDLYEAAAGLMTACVDEPDGREVWLILAPNVREIIRSALRLGPPKQRGRPKQKKGQRSNQARRSNLMKKRQIAKDTGLIQPALSRGTLTGCSIVASALGKSERQIERIYGENKPS